MSDNIKLIESVRALEKDHGPDGWPAVQMKTLSALADALEAVRMNAAQPVDERKEFEDWGRSIGWDTRDLERSSAYRGKYGWKTQQTAWEAWQARAALSAPAVNAGVPQGVPESDAFKAYLKECDDCAIEPDVAGAFHWAWNRCAAAPEAPAQPEKSAEDESELLTIAYMAGYEKGKDAGRAEQGRKPLSAREVELIDGMIKVQLLHAQDCDRIANRVMAEKQKGWDMERVELLRKLKAAHGIKE